MKGFANLVLARSELLPATRAALKDAHAALERKNGGSEDERILVDALAIQPDDAWGLHAVSHVFEMRGNTRQGID